MQPILFRLVGWVKLCLDTLLQRAINAGAQRDIPLFSAPPRPDLLRGKTAIVTGSNTGIGFETARWLAASGATVVVACRSMAKATAAAGAISSSIDCSASIEPAELDLSDFSSVRKFAELFSRSGGQRDSQDEGPRKVHMLILNAGVMCVEQREPETHYMVNHVAHGLLSLLMTPSLAAASSVDGHARIVFVSSLTYLVSQLDLDDLAFTQRPYKSFIAYANSKMCNVLFMHALSARLGSTGIVCNAVHPGESTTDVARNLGSLWMTLHKRVGALFLLSPREAARTSVYAASEHSSAEPNMFYHAVRRKLSVPSRLISVNDIERLWEMTLRDASITTSELEAFDAVCGKSANTANKPERAKLE